VSDLSRLLGDVYGTGPVEDHVDEAPAPSGEERSPLAELPTWADESVLDEAFANWVPGPSTEAPAEEHAAVAEPAPAPEAHALPAEAAWFFDAPGEVAAFPTAIAEPEPETEPEAPAVVWQRADDDLLPARGRRKKR
jgi:hypothetical protein